MGSKSSEGISNPRRGLEGSPPDQSNPQLLTISHDVDRYKRCINDFVEEQREAIQRHEDAAQEAIDEWNRFVRYELN
jgi:hypothetical protein